MDATAHQVAGSVIDDAVTADRILAGKRGGDYGDFVMATAIPGTGMADMAMRLIFDLQRLRLQHGQALAQQIEGCTAHAGRTFLNGLMVTSS